ncbi:magnesium transporter [Xylanimonas ulmi]|uniref:Magnesium transporter MgtE n=1 Tax=Xylanimonas ulmi TaxID=228973 RepID=A0A4Q7M5K8_9MICO|nr:magnesium transporter [Xylanibacterium ulmi]RZS62267.1 magnesium transporter [Xylanibacterium ulmi]
MSLAVTTVQPVAPATDAAAFDAAAFEKDTAGRIMTTAYIALERSLTAAEAIDAVRAQAHDAETIYTLYVVGHSGRLEGAISLRELLVAAPTSLVSTIMSQPPIFVRTDADQERVARQMADLDLIAIPVVDADTRLVGIVTVDDAIDVIDDETTEDMYKAAGLADVRTSQTEVSRSEQMTHGSLWSIMRSRLPFLAITLVGGMVAGGIVEGFEETLESVIVVAFFIPLIMDMGGSVGTQSSTVFARAVALGHIDIKTFRRPFLKEAAVGVTLGTLVGLAGGLVAGVWQQDLYLGLAVGGALITTMTLSAMLGFLVPWFLIKIGTDHASGAAPIVTSIKDISGLAIYFSFVALFMGHLI